MFCTQCGVQLGEQEPNFCPACGKQTRAGYSSVRPGQKTLRRPLQGRRIAGVCAGFAEYLDVDVTLIRIAWVVAFFCFGTGLLAYLVASIIMPNEDPRSVRDAVAAN